MREYDAWVEREHDRIFGAWCDERVQIWHAAALLREAGYDIDEYETYIHIFRLNADAVGVFVGISEQDDGEWSARVEPFPAPPDFRPYHARRVWVRRDDEDVFLADVRALVEGGAC